MLHKELEALRELLSLEFYRFKRYNVPFCLILVEIEDKLFHEVLDGTIRKVDQYEKIDHNFYAIVYAHAKADDARNAFFNLFHALDEESVISKLSIAEVLTTDTSEYDVIERAYNGFKE